MIEQLYLFIYIPSVYEFHAISASTIWGETGNVLIL